ncbi:MAG: hypothetical protein OXI16_06205 [Chloroflexota bacterium]|nr:hypothetical protein [Chloroflexota bacterium]
MSKLTGVQFKPFDKVLYFDAGELELVVGERVVVEAWDGEREVVVAIAPDQALHSDLRGELDRVVRKAEPE